MNKEKKNNKAPLPEGRSPAEADNWAAFSLRYKQPPARPESQPAQFSSLQPVVFSSAGTCRVKSSLGKTDFHTFVR